MDLILEIIFLFLINNTPRTIKTASKVISLARSRIPVYPADKFIITTIRTYMIEKHPKENKKTPIIYETSTFFDNLNTLI